MDSREEEHMMLPPRDSNSATTSSADLFLVLFIYDWVSQWTIVLFVVHTLKANLSRIWLTPLVFAVSYRLPASTYTPTALKCPGVFSEAMRIPLGRVVTLQRPVEAFEYS